MYCVPSRLSSAGLLISVGLLNSVIDIHVVVVVVVVDIVLVSGLYFAYMKRRGGGTPFLQNPNDYC